MLGLCDICQQYFKHKHKHHIHSKSLGGNNKKANICHVCPNCHTKIHYGEIIIEGWFNTSNGLKLIWRTKNDSPIVSSSDPEVFLFS